MLALQGPSVVSVGRVNVVFWPGEEAAATVLAEMADGAGPWPGIQGDSGRPLRIVLAATDERFDSITRGRLPDWGGGAAFPASNTIVLKLEGNVRRVLLHELAHLALHSRVRRVPLWFDEGYAARAAAEWGRLQALRVNWALLTGSTPTLRQLDRDLRAGAARAETAYALATTAVVKLERMGGDRGLEPLISNLAESADFDATLRVTYQVTLGQFEELWRQELRRRYGWILLFGSLSVFWSVLGLVLLSLWWWRKRRYRDRRAALDEGWVVPPEWHASA
jgi:hypothetical protein